MYKDLKFPVLIVHRDIKADTVAARGDVEAVPIDELERRVAALRLVPYPPGIPLFMPGERFTESTRSIIDYLKFARTFDSSFPGFVADVHGLQHEDEGNGRQCTVDCVKE
ncbi:hypothetical protein EMIT0347P_10544 [Pseudomonas sp. IT-347P]